MINIHTTEFNEARHPQNWQYHRRRFTDTHNGWTEGKYDASEVANALRHCADLIESSYSDLTTQLENIGDVHAFLDMSRRLIPLIDGGWCVVKHYHDHTPGRPWEPRVWIACVTKEQADAMAPAIQAHYDSKGRPSGDKFLVEQRPAFIHDFIQPWVTPAEYARSLG